MCVFILFQKALQDVVVGTPCTALRTSLSTDADGVSEEVLHIPRASLNCNVGVLGGGSHHDGVSVSADHFESNWRNEMWGLTCEAMFWEIPSTRCSYALAFALSRVQKVNATTAILSEKNFSLVSELFPSAG